MRWWEDRSGRAGALLLLVLFSLGIGAPFLAPHDPRAQDRTRLYYSPSLPSEGCPWALDRADETSLDAERCRFNVLGTDGLGRDLLSRALYGTRWSIGTTALGVVVTVALGTLVGALSGFLGGGWDRLLMRFTELIMALPALYLVLAVRTLFPDHLTLGQSAIILVGSLSAVGWCVVSRLVRGQVLSLRERDFVSSAIAAGATRRRVLFRHILPNVFPFVLLQAGLTLPYFLLGEATLSYLGLGVQEPEPSWGNMLASAASNYTDMTTYWWTLVVPGAALSLAVLGANLWIEGLRRSYLGGLSGDSDSSGMGRGS